MKRINLLLTLLILMFVINYSWAENNLKLHKVTHNVYAIVGELGNRTEENLGNNATFGFVITNDGIVLIDSGGSYLGAKAIAAIIKSVTDKPVIRVINTGGQDHRWLGNSYFKHQGASIIANKMAVADQKARFQDQYYMLANLVGDKGLKNTEAVYADVTFTKKNEFTQGGVQFEIYHEGQAHTPGDSFVWLPQMKVMFTGDIVYVERMLRVGLHSNSKSWIKVYEKMAAFKPQHLIPGHGHPTNLNQANKDTYDYLVFLRHSVSTFIENGGEMTEVASVKQTDFNYLLNHEKLAGRNAQQVFTEMEWE